MRIFLDANVLFFAAKSDGAVRQLLALLIDAGHECWADGYVVEEARRNLLAKAPEAVQVLDAFLARMNLAAAHAVPETIEASLAVPEKDRPVLAAAIRLRCDALVTGDRTHFGAFYGKRLGGVAIYSPRSRQRSCASQAAHALNLNPS
jgi:predicted nucleic acid-binding protein